jgi:hypothetical protein
LAIGNTKLPKKRAAGKKRQRQEGKKRAGKKVGYAEKVLLDKRRWQENGMVKEKEGRKEGAMYLLRIFPLL